MSNSQLFSDHQGKNWCVPSCYAYKFSDQVSTETMDGLEGTTGEMVFNNTNGYPMYYTGSEWTQFFSGTGFTGATGSAGQTGRTGPTGPTGPSSASKQYFRAFKTISQSASGSGATTPVTWNQVLFQSPVCNIGLSGPSGNAIYFSSSLGAVYINAQIQFGLSGGTGGEITPKNWYITQSGSTGANLLICGTQDVFGNQSLSTMANIVAGDTIQIALQNNVSPPIGMGGNTPGNGELSIFQV